MSMITDDNLAKLIDKHRRLAGLKKTQIADIMGVSNTSVSKWCRTGKITKDNLAELAKLINLPIEEIYKNSYPGLPKDRDELAAYALQEFVSFLVEYQLKPSKEAFKEVYLDILTFIDEEAKSPSPTVIKLLAKRIM